MSPNKKHRREPGGLALAEEAMHLLRTAPLAAPMAYCIGTVPFVLGFLYFWTDMSRSALAPARCLPGSLALVGLFLWMKCWQAVFTAGLLDWVRGHAPSAWPVRRIVRMCLAQCALQPPGLLAIPLALLAMFPFYAVHAFYQNLAVFGDGQSGDWREAVRRAWRQARLWPRQNHVLLWLFSPWVLATGLLAAFVTAWAVFRTMPPDLRGFGDGGWMSLMQLLIFQFVLPFAPFGCAVAANIGVVIVMLPQLLHDLLGVETVFTLGEGVWLQNTTLLMCIFGLSYLVLDPLIKSAHVLRCFHGESQTTGEDLMVELKAHARAAGGVDP